MKTLSIKLLLVSGLFASLLAFVGACTANAEKNDVIFDLQPGNITKPSGVWFN